MSFQVTCDECGARLRVSEERAGRTLRCRKCGADIDVLEESTGRGVHWGVWAGIGGAVAAVVVAVAVVIATSGNRDQPPNPNPVEVVVQPEAPPESTKAKRPIRKPRDATTLEQRLEEAKRYQEAVARKEKAELELFKKRADWSYRFRDLLAERQKAFPPLVVPFDQALIKAALEASDARDEKRRVRLAEERNAFATDPLRISMSPEVREAAVKYVEARLELERQFATKFSELKGAMPHGVAIGDQRTVAEQLAAAEEGVRRMESARTQLAALPMPRPAGPMPLPKKTAVAQAPKKQPADLPRRKEPEFLGPAPAGWSVEVDPPKERLEFPKQLGYSFAGDSRQMLYPPGRTAYAGVGIGRVDIEGYTIVDLRTGKAVGRASGIDVRYEPQSVGGPALSGDGTYLALYDSVKKKVLVGNLKARKGGVILDYAGESPALLFPTPTQVLALPTYGKTPAKIWELPSGKELRSFQTVEDPSKESGRMGISPGGRFLAIAAESSRPHHMHFYDLSTGRKVGRLEAPGGNSNLEPYFVAAAFSPDGSEFAAFVEAVQVGMNVGEAMCCWDVKTGRLTYYKILDRGPGRGMLLNIAAEPLQWFPDGKGWLLFQLYVVDREAGAVVDSLKPDANSSHFGTKILDDRRVLIGAAGRMRPYEVKRFAGERK